MITQMIKDGQVVDTSAEGTSSSTTTKETNSSLDKEAFLQLLVAQMKYQDPLEPTDNTTYITQLATFTQVEEIQNMQSSLQQMEANDLVGKTVILKVTNSATGSTDEVVGQVDAVLHEGSKTYLSVNDATYSIDDLYSVMDDTYLDAISLAKSFSVAVNSLPSLTMLTDSDAEKVSNLRKAYEAMTDYQKTFIDSADLEKLEKAEAQIKLIQGDTGTEGEGDADGDSGTDDGDTGTE